MHWSENSFWVEALEHYHAARENGLETVTINLNEIEKIAFNGDGPAYSLMHAMESVLEFEAMDGYRGAPRIMLALLLHLSSVSGDSGRQEPTV